MDNADKENNKQNNRQNIHQKACWKFCKIKFDKVEQDKKVKIIVPTCTIALQVGNKFYLGHKTIKRNKSNNIHIIERYDYIPQGANKELIAYYIRHIKQQQEKLNIPKV